MFPPFLPPTAQHLTEATSIALAQQIQQRAIATPLSAHPIDTAYVHQGEGTSPVLMVHGFDSSVMEYRRLLPQMAQHYDTWAIDLLGFGFTQRPDDVLFSAADIKQHLHATWKELIRQPIILVGASMGGAAAMDFAATYPELVKALILLDSAGAGKGPNMGRFLVPPMGYLATEFLRNPKVRQSISRAAYFDKSFATADAACCAALHLASPDWSRSMVAFTRSGGYNVLTQQHMAKIQAPTLILWGKQDQILGTAEASKINRHISSSKLIWLEDCGHVPHLEKSAIVAQHIQTFISHSP
ncbi:MAG: alpha/beta hydrolase [Elainellaceae cyanobacterium]